MRCFIMNFLLHLGWPARAIILIYCPQNTHAVLYGNESFEEHCITLDFELHEENTAIESFFFMENYIISL